MMYYVRRANTPGSFGSPAAGKEQRASAEAQRLKRDNKKTLVFTLMLLNTPVIANAEIVDTVTHLRDGHPLSFEQLPQPRGVFLQPVRGCGKIGQRDLRQSDSQPPMSNTTVRVRVRVRRPFSGMTGEKRQSL